MVPLFYNVPAIVMVPLLHILPLVFFARLFDSGFIIISKTLATPNLNQIKKYFRMYIPSRPRFKKSFSNYL